MELLAWASPSKAASVRTVSRNGSTEMVSDGSIVTFLFFKARIPRKKINPPGGWGAAAGPAPSPPQGQSSSSSSMRTLDRNSQSFWKCSTSSSEFLPEVA